MLVNFLEGYLSIVMVIFIASGLSVGFIILNFLLENILRMKDNIINIKA